ncbi:MAG: hypothetical protein LBL13_04050 [Bacteroidales bacterium]|nr:hypothetical protein [Bacteroidales bacterium]
MKGKKGRRDEGTKGRKGTRRKQKLVHLSTCSLFSSFHPVNPAQKLWIASFLAMTSKRVQCNRRNVRRFSVIARNEAIQKASNPEQNSDRRKGERNKQRTFPCALLSIACCWLPVFPFALLFHGLPACCLLLAACCLVLVTLLTMVGY